MHRAPTFRRMFAERRDRGRGTTHRAPTLRGMFEERQGRGRGTLPRARR